MRPLWAGLSHLIGACVLRLRDTYATPGGATAAGLGLTLAGALLARTAVTALTHLCAVRRQALWHAQTARLAGHPEPALGVTLVDHPQPAAYCVAGRQPTVVLTTGALRALDPAQLDAVLAHERAHLAGRHHRLLAMARLARQVLPLIPLMCEADAQVTRLCRRRHVIALRQHLFSAACREPAAKLSRRELPRATARRPQFARSRSSRAACPGNGDAQ